MPPERAFRAIVLDFDGVILESVAIKARAFRELVPGPPALQDRMERYHYENLGMSRYDKFTWLCRTLCGYSPTPEELASLDQRFEAAVADQLRRCPFVAGAREFLDRHAQREPLFVASATPERPLRALIADRGLAALFTGIYGAPIGKAEALTRVAAAVGGPPEAILFVGDSRQDAQAARARGATFVARVVPPDDPFDDTPAMRVADLAELDARFDELCRHLPA